MTEIERKRGLPLTMQELSQFRYLKKEIKTEKERLAALEAVATNPGVKVPGLPHIGAVANNPNVAPVLADCKNTVAARIQRSEQEYERINQFISDIGDSWIKQAIVCRFVKGMTWSKTAITIGGGNLPGSVQTACRRFLQKKNAQNTAPKVP